jgi:hypothetical protein
MRTWRRAVTVLVVLATAFLFYRWFENMSSRAAPRAGALDEGDDPSTAPGPRAPHLAAKRPPPPGAPSAEPAAPVLDRAKADKMREELHALFAEAGVLALGGAPLDASAAPPPHGFGTMPTKLDDAGETVVDPKYIQSRVREDLFPLAKDCYVHALEKKPRLGGKLAVYFRVIGDEKVGGVVDEVKMMNETTLDDPEMVTCVKESMMSVSFAAPPGGGELTVVYPIVFSPDDDDAGADQ